MELKAKRVALTAIFGALIFLSKTFVPYPIDKMFMIVHALLLALGALLLGRMGATYVSVIGGVLTALWRTAMAPFTFFFALLYGLFVDLFFFIFRVDITEGTVKTSRLVASMAVSTAFVGGISYYTTVYLVPLLPRNPVLERSILVVGTFSGVVAGYLASNIWNRYLKNVRL